MAYTKKNPYLEGNITYYNDAQGNKYKNDVLVPAKNNKYLPNVIGGTRDNKVLGGGTVENFGLPGINPTETIVTGDETGVSTGGNVLPGNIFGAETESRLGSLTSAIDTPFDPESVMDSTLYKSQKQSYEQQGQDAFQNTMGSLAALTGGRASSAAIGQAANAYSQYNQQFAANVLPQLTEQSYNQYQDNITNQGKLYEILANKDLTEYEKKFEYEKYQWDKSEDNPDVKAQMIANKISQINLDNLPEEIRLEFGKMAEDLKQMQITTKYMPRENEAKLNEYKAKLDNYESMINAREEEKIDNLPTTGTQLASYNKQLDGYRTQYADDLNQALMAIDEPATKEYLIQQLGQKGYDNLINQLAQDATAEPKEKDPSSYGLGDIRNSLDAVNDKYSMTTIDTYSGTEKITRDLTPEEIQANETKRIKEMLEIIGNMRESFKDDLEIRDTLRNYGLPTDPDEIDKILNSGATQTIPEFDPNTWLQGG